MSDGITAHALRRAGWRVGVAADIYATHLGDADPAAHPDYLARKQSASGWRTTYPHYPELAASGDPPTLHELALAAPLLAALDRHAIAPDDVVELAAPRVLLGAADPRIAAFAGVPPAARAVAVLAPDRADAGVAARAFAQASEWVLLLCGPAVPDAADGWELAAEYPGPHPVVARLARVASRPRWRRRLLYSASEHREQWLALFRAGCFGEDQPLRVYVFRRTTDAEPAAVEGSSRALAPASHRLRLRRRRVAALTTKLRRLVRAEWRLARGRRDSR
jgi:hypothetical protein